MKYRFLSIIVGLFACVASALGADFIEIKDTQGRDTLRIPIKSGGAYHAQLQPLGDAGALGSGAAGEEQETGFYVGYSLRATVTEDGLDVSFVGNLLQGFIDFGTPSEGRKLSPVLDRFEKEFSLKEPGTEWTKVAVSKDASYQVRWIRESKAAVE